MPSIWRCRRRGTRRHVAGVDARRPCPVVDDAAEHVQRAERTTSGGTRRRDDHAVDAPSTAPRAIPSSTSEHRDAGDRETSTRSERRQAEDRANRQVDAAGDDHDAWPTARITRIDDGQQDVAKLSALQEAGLLASGDDQRDEHERDQEIRLAEAGGRLWTLREGWLWLAWTIRRLLI